MGLAWWGWPTLATGVLAAWILAALYALARGVAGRRGTLAFAPFLLAGALVALASMATATAVSVVPAAASTTPTWTQTTS